MNEGDFVGEAGQVRDHLRHHLPGLAARLEFVLRPGEIPRRPLERHRRSTGERLVVVLHKLRLPVPGLELADSTGTEDHEHALGPRREMGGTWHIGAGGIDQWHDRAAVAIGRAVGGQPVAGEEIKERHPAGRGGGMAEEAPPVEEARAGGGESGHGWHARPVREG